MDWQDLCFVIVLIIIVFLQPFMDFGFSEKEKTSEEYQIEHDKKQAASDYDDPLMRRPLQ